MLQLAVSSHWGVNTWKTHSEDRCWILWLVYTYSLGIKSQRRSAPVPHTTGADLNYQALLGTCQQISCSGCRAPLLPCPHSRCSWWTDQRSNLQMGPAHGFAERVGTDRNWNLQWFVLTCCLWTVVTEERWTTSCSTIFATDVGITGSCSKWRQTAEVLTMSEGPAGSQINTCMFAPKTCNTLQGYFASAGALTLLIDCFQL